MIVVYYFILRMYQALRVDDDDGVNYTFNVDALCLDNYNINVY